MAVGNFENCLPYTLREEGGYLIIAAIPAAAPNGALRMPPMTSTGGATACRCARLHHDESEMQASMWATGQRRG